MMSRKTCWRERRRRTTVTSKRTVGRETAICHFWARSFVDHLQRFSASGLLPKLIPLLSQSLSLVYIAYNIVGFESADAYLICSIPSVLLDGERYGSRCHCERMV